MVVDILAEISPEIGGKSSEEAVYPADSSDVATFDTGQNKPRMKLSGVWCCEGNNSGGQRNRSQRKRVANKAPTGMQEI